MMRVSIGIVGALLASACIAQPSFDTSNVDPSGSAVGAADEMVLVPATTLAHANVTPTNRKPDEAKGNNGKGKGKGKGNGDGKGDGNNGKCKGDEEDRDGCNPSDGSSSGGPSTGSSSGGSAPPGKDGSSGDPPAQTNDQGSGVVASFWIDTLEVSVREYGACVAARGCSPAGAGAGCTGPAGLGDHPITCVTRSQASAFCAWKKKRLVRDLEWTAASAGADARAYPWGADAPSPERVNACGLECSSSGMFAGRDGFTATAPCGSFPLGRSPEGVFDLAGNVAEWVDAPDAIVRGGSYADVDPSAVSSSSSRAVAADAAEPTIGFRCARDP